MLPPRPPRGSSAHREWIRARVSESGCTTRAAFLAWAQQHPVDRRPQKRDLAAAGGWSAVRASAPREPVSYEVDLRDLDYDEDGADTIPGGFPDASPEASIKELVALQRARAEAADLRRRLRDALHEVGIADERAALVGELSAGELTPIRFRAAPKSRRRATAVVLASDWHIEEVVRPEAVEWRNAYSPAVAQRRVERMAQGIMWLTSMHRERFAIDDLVLWLGGDLISGYLHEELEETNALTPVEATLFAQQLIVGMVDMLLAEGTFERIRIPCNTGNHGRTTRRTRFKTRVKNSYEYLIYRRLADHYASDPRVEIEIAGGSHLYLEVYGQTLRFHHGDDVKYWGGVGGLSIPLNKAIAKWQGFRRADLTCVGHFHQYLHGTDWCVNGSLKGYDEFSLAIKADYEPPRQAYFLLDAERGRCCKSPIWVTDQGAGA